MNRKTKSDKRSSRIAIRTTKSEHDAIAHRAMHAHQSISTYCLSAIHRRHGNTKVVELNKSNRGRLLKGISVLENEMQERHSDYSRALANFNHCMHLYNMGQVPNINRNALVGAINTIYSNQEELSSINQHLHSLEAILWKS